MRGQGVTDAKTPYMWNYFPQLPKHQDFCVVSFQIEGILLYIEF